MSHPDAEAVHNLFSAPEDDTLMNFTASEYLFMQDLQQGNYGAGQIRYDTLVSKDQWVIWADSWLAIPLSVSSANATPFNGHENIAFKTSVLSLINSIQITTASGQTIVNDNQYIQYINNLRLLLETAFDAQFTNMNDLQLWKDTSLPPFTAAGAGATVGQIGWNSGSPSVGTNETIATSDPQQFTYNAAAGAPPPGSSVANINPAYNEGFAKRVQFFKANASFAAGVYSMIVTIPLKYIHPFFAALSFPVINTRFQFTFNTPVRFVSATPGIPASDMPLMVDPVTLATNAGYKVGIGASTLPGSILSGSTRIYYRRVAFSPEVNEKVKNMLQRGYSKTLEFSVLDAYPTLINAGAPLPNPNALTSINQLISSSTVAPLRLWFIPLASTSTNISGAGDNISQNTSFTQPFIARGYATNLNVLVNSVPYYPNDLLIDREAWQVIEEQTIANGSKDSVGALIGFQDFIGNYRFYCVDLTRYKERLINPSESVNLIFKAQYYNGDAAATASQSTTPLFLVERNQVVKFSFSSGETRVLIGSASTA